MSIRQKFGFEVLKAVTMKRTIFLDAIKYISVEVYQRFARANCLDLQVRRLNQASNQQEEG
jgi:hypothetical protein